MAEKWEPAGIPPGKYGIAWKEYTIGKYRVLDVWIYRLFRNGIFIEQGSSAEPLKQLAKQHRKEHEKSK